MKNHILWEKMQVRVKQDNEGKRGEWGGVGVGRDAVGDRNN